MNLPGKECVMTGWGKKQPNGEGTSNILQKVNYYLLLYLWDKTTL